VPSRALLCVLVLFGCAPRAPSPRVNPRGDAVDGGRPPLATVGSHPHPCAREEKDAVGCILDCDRGIAFACLELASRFERGADVPRDLARAAALNERACELKDSAGCTAAARMYAAGIGVPPSRARQLDYLERACANGDPLACAVPARAFATGIGVPRDERRAKKLLEHACLGGVESACEQIESGDAGY
jgi:hypothetical protein